MTWSRMLVVVVVATLSATGVVAASKEPPILLRVGPSISFEPGIIRITSRVEPKPQNRALVIVVQSSTHYSSSEVTLEGEQAPRSRSILLKNLPAGSYEVVATLRTETGAATVVRDRFQVVSGREDEP